MVTLYLGHEAKNIIYIFMSTLFDKAEMEERQSTCRRVHPGPQVSTLPAGKLVFLM
jgi:hypothetical protein